MAHYHKLKDGSKTGPNKVMFQGGHVHELPDDSLTAPAEDSKTHVHLLPDGSLTPSGPVEIEDDDSEEELEDE